MLAQLGLLAYERAKSATQDQRAAILDHLAVSETRLREGIKRLPPPLQRVRALVRYRLACTLREGGLVHGKSAVELGKALDELVVALRDAEAAGDASMATDIRLTTARVLRDLERCAAAAQYAVAAKAGFEALGPQGASGSAAAQRLLDEITATEKAEAI